VSESTISASSQTTYIITYTAADRAGNNATPIIRSIIIGSESTESDESGTEDPAAPDNSESADSVPPVVTLVGDTAIEIVVGDAFTDPGATATDPSTGSGQATDLTAYINVSGSVDTAVAGLYTLTYTATDAAGNSGSASRVVTVVAAAEEPAAPAVDAAPAE